MHRGMSVHIGLNNLDQTHYLDTDFRFLASSRKDATDMAEIAKKNFTEPVPVFNQPNLLLLDQLATTKNLIDILSEAATGSDKLGSGDTLLITYSGHGGQVEDKEETESDGAHETWCLFDRQFLDDELFELFTRFEKGVRILVISDSCFNGTITGSVGLDFAEVNKILAFTKSFEFNNFEGKVLKVKELEPVKFDESRWEKNENILKEIDFDSSDKNLRTLPVEKFKAIPPAVLEAINDDPNNKLIYKKIQEQANLTLLRKKSDEKKNDPRDLAKASILLISACQDWQVTRPGKKEDENSKFTEVLKAVLQEGNFKNYLELHLRLWEFFDQNATQPSEIQSPNYYKIGTPNPEFEMEMPFTV